MQIKIRRLEGCGYFGDSDVTSWIEANYALRLMAWTAPKDGGYDKVSFVINFPNGVQYVGRYDVKYSDRYSADLYEHIQKHIAVRSCPEEVRETIGLYKPKTQEINSWI